MAPLTKPKSNHQGFHTIPATCTIEMVSAPNRGVSVARNAGAKISTGEYDVPLTAMMSSHPQLGRLRQHVESDHRPDIIAWSYETVTHPPHPRARLTALPRTAASPRSGAIASDPRHVHPGVDRKCRLPPNCILRPPRWCISPRLLKVGEDREFIYKAVAGATSTLVLDDKVVLLRRSSRITFLGGRTRHFQAYLPIWRAKDHIAAMGDHSLEPLANLIVTRKPFRPTFDISHDTLPLLRKMVTSLRF